MTDAAGFAVHARLWRLPGTSLRYFRSFQEGSHANFANLYLGASHIVMGCLPGNLCRLGAARETRAADGVADCSFRSCPIRRVRPPAALFRTECRAIRPAGAIFVTRGRVHAVPDRYRGRDGARPGRQEAANSSAPAGRPAKPGTDGGAPEAGGRADAFHLGFARKAARHQQLFPGQRSAELAPQRSQLWGRRGARSLPRHRLDLAWPWKAVGIRLDRSEEHTSELQ